MTDWPQGYDLKRYEEIDSTNEAARRFAAEGQTGPLWIAAARQTAGRGRQGRSWVTRSGNLAATLLLQPGKPRQDWAQLSFVAAIAACDTAAKFLPDADVKLKWPNDVLADGKKLAGILLETVDDKSLAIGIGINILHHPADIEFLATSIAALSAKPPTLDDVMAVLAVSFTKWYDIWMAQGFGAIRDAWLARAAGLGKRIRARLVAEEKSGMFEGLDENGALLLRDASGQLQALPAADIFFG